MNAIRRGPIVCQACGRTLAAGERCNCAQPVAGARGDGLRARCPRFIARCSYRAKSYILCGDVSLEVTKPDWAGYKEAFPDSATRNEHYRRYCCGLYGACAAYKAEKEDGKHGQ